MKKAAIFEERLNNLALDIYNHFLGIIKREKTIKIETDDILSVYHAQTLHEVHPLSVRHDGVQTKIKVCRVEQKNNPFEVYFSDFQSIEDKLLLIDLMEDNLPIEIKDLGNLKEVGGTFNPNEI